MAICYSPDLKDILSAQTEDPASRRTLNLLQNFGPLLGFLQQIFRVTCSFIKNGLRGKKTQFTGLLCYIFISPEKV